MAGILAVTLSLIFSPQRSRLRLHVSCPRAWALCQLAISAVLLTKPRVGKSQDQLRRAGRWCGQGAMHESYLTGIPYDFLRMVAGYGDQGYLLRPMT